MDPHTLTRELKEYAASLGFDPVGVTTAAPFVEAGRAAEARVEAGLMDGLPWFTVDRVRFAADPRNHLPDARSLVSLGISYLTVSGVDRVRSTECDVPDSVVLRTPYSVPAGDDGRTAPPGPRPPDPGPPRGRVARYAWGADYHKVIERKLKALAGWLRERCGPDVPVKTFVDVGRMFDRAAAQRAGLGWFGKNTNILSRRRGSWIFLAELLTNVELVPDLPVRTHCGACTRCLEVCPTGALVAPGVLDNRRCISHLTIEERGPIPRHLRPLIGDWIFGCDLCQDICPVNRKALPSEEPAFAPDGALAPEPELIPLLALSEEDFRERFRGSAIKRARRDGFVRNVAVALGNSGDPAAVPALAAALADASPLVRGHAAWALGRLGGPTAREALRARRASEEDAWVREEIDLALQECDVRCSTWAPTP